MKYLSLSNIPFTKERAVIINVGTRFVTTLALFSAINKTGMPVLLIDCTIKGNVEDFNYFEMLMKDHNFDLISIPLNDHGKTLDFIFTNLNVDYILLVDSDLEIIDKQYVRLMKQYISKENIFGTGFIHGSWWLKKTEWEEPRDGYYEERIWIPFTLLKTKYIKEAIENNISFNAQLFYNLVPKNQYLSRKLLYRVRFLKDSEFTLFNVLKKKFHGRIPLLVLYDTGSHMYQYLRYKKNLFFAGIDVNTGIEEQYVHHFNGITRKLLFDDQYHCSSIEEEYVNIKNRLLNEYSFDYDEFNNLFIKNI